MQKNLISPPNPQSCVRALRFGRRLQEDRAGVSGLESLLRTLAGKLWSFALSLPLKARQGDLETWRQESGRLSNKLGAGSKVPMATPLRECVS